MYLKAYLGKNWYKSSQYGRSKLLFDILKCVILWNWKFDELSGYKEARVALSTVSGSVSNVNGAFINGVNLKWICKYIPCTGTTN